MMVTMHLRTMLQSALQRPRITTQIPIVIDTSADRHAVVPRFIQAQQVKLPQGQSGAAFAMVGQHCFGSQPQLTTDAGLRDVQMATKSIGKPWATISGYANVLRALAQSSRHAGKLLGSDDETKKQVRLFPSAACGMHLQVPECETGDVRIEKVCCCFVTGCRHASHQHASWQCMWRIVPSTVQI